MEPSYHTAQVVSSVVDYYSVRVVVENSTYILDAGLRVDGLNHNMSTGGIVPNLEWDVCESSTPKHSYILPECVCDVKALVGQQILIHPGQPFGVVHVVEFRLQLYGGGILSVSKII